MRRIVGVGLLVLFAFYLFFLRTKCSSIFISGCGYVCDRKGRHASAYKPGILTACICGNRKKVPAGMPRP